mmetsp:Transcript_17172/g.35571  ORF Transcript_17172/g.35571 Transcript_17172/m.35571 type:complete len:234 (-) Transcript_17172:92-793(-)
MMPERNPLQPINHPGTSTTTHRSTMGPPPSIAFSNPPSSVPMGEPVERHRRQSSASEEDVAPFAVHSPALTSGNHAVRSTLSVSPLLMHRPSPSQHHVESLMIPSNNNHTNNIHPDASSTMVEPPTLPPRSQLAHRTSTTTTNVPPGATSLALSADLLRVLNMSTLDTGSLLLDTATDPEATSSHVHPEQSEERQYLWLERYHAHVAAQERGDVQPTENHRDRDDPGTSNNIV